MKNNRRTFLKSAAGSAIASAAVPLFAKSAGFRFWSPDQQAPSVQFPTAPRERVAVASYPFRDFIAGARDPHATSSKMPLKEFAGHVRQKFNVNKIEPWSEHFVSTDAAYLDELRSTVTKAGCGFANIAADGENSFYSPDSGVRAKAVAFGRKWIDIAAHIGSPSVRINLPPARDTKPEAAVVAESLKVLAAYGASKNVVLHHENDNPLSENPFFIADVLDRVSSPWDRALPDFGNSFSALPVEEAFRGLEQMFAHAYGISHVKDVSMTPKREAIAVDLGRAFAIAKEHNYKGYFSMEWDTEGDPYAGTENLIVVTLKNIS
ncbi:MAG TPA: TIM barrel protein [Candidatus Acidoferrum sp.]|nr:TIM barrel protein [Candidatus Acidoferrum sp.]